MNFSLIYGANCPPELKNIIAPMFEKFQLLVPKWVEDVYVTFDDEQDENYTVVETITVKEYRNIQLRFYPDFIYTRTDKLYHFVHELCHAIYGAVYQYSYTNFTNLLSDIGDEKLKRHVLEELRKYNESSTQDLTNLIFTLMRIDKRTGKSIKRGK